MTTLLAFAILGTVAWFIFAGAYKTSFKDPATLRESELEDAFIELKKKILVTSAYDHEQIYQHLYYRMKAVLGQIIVRHKHFVLDVEAKSTDLNRFFQRRAHRDANGMTYYEYAVPQDLDMQAQQSEVLLYSCFFLWLGGKAKGVGSVSDDPALMLKILDHLIEVRQFPSAMFFKGMILKYGAKVYEPSSHSAARPLLEAAQVRGVGAAAIELQQLNKYVQLDGIKSVHFD